MPFQGWNFIRNQNFTRDRNAGPPDHFISAEKVDDELSNIADGLTETRVAAATADEKATVESQAAEARSVTTVRGGVAGAYDTLKKLYDWTVAQLATKLNTAGGTLTGDITISRDGVAPSLWFRRPGVKHGRWCIDGSGNMVWLDENATTHFRITPNGALWTQEFGDLNTRIETRAAAFADSRLVTVRGGVAGAYDTLKKLYDWTVAQLATKLNTAGGTLTGDLIITKNQPKLTLRDLAATGDRGLVNISGELRAFRDDQSGTFYIRDDGSLWSRQMGEVKGYIDGAAAAAANSKDALINSKAGGDSITVVGFAGNDVALPYLRRASDGGVYYLQPHLGYTPVISRNPGRIALEWFSNLAYFIVDASSFRVLTAEHDDARINEKFNNQRITGRYNGDRSGFSQAASGAVCVGYARATGEQGQVAYLTFGYLQNFSPSRGWVSAYTE